MSGLEIQSTGEIVASYNGEIVENAKWNMDYDGNIMNIESLHNDELTVIQMDNNDLHKLFGSIGTNENSMENRLKRDFGKKNNYNNTKRVRFLDDRLRKTGSHKTPIVIKRSLSTKRKSSPKHSSPKRSSPKRKSSPKRSSPKRSSPMRSSPKHKSTKRKKLSSSKKRTKRNSVENTIY